MYQIGDGLPVARFPSDIFKESRLGFQFDSHLTEAQFALYSIAGRRRP